jgi:hypothetical protein
MTIYTLYIKTHRKTGLKYFGQTKQDPYSYPGSGVDWTNHINDYGRDIYTEILLQTSDKSERNYWGRYYSKLWKIVTAMDDYGNKIWANRIPETGGGCGTGLTGWANPQYGKAPWNKGLTKADDYRIAQYATTLTGKVGHPAWNKGIKLEGAELEEHRERTRNRKIDPIKQAEGQKKRVEKTFNQLIRI